MTNITDTENLVKEKITESETLGKRIAYIRKSLKLDQTKFAKKIGITSPVSISRYENNRVEPEISILVKIAKLGNVDLDWLLTGKTIEDIEKMRLSEWVLRSHFWAELIEKYEESINRELKLIYKFGKEKLPKEEVKRIKDEKTFIEDIKHQLDRQNIYKEGEMPLQAVAEPPPPEYKTEPLELTRLKAQMERIYKGRDKETIAKLQGFLAALDPGEKGG